MDQFHLLSRKINDKKKDILFCKRAVSCVLEGVNSKHISERGAGLQTSILLFNVKILFDSLALMNNMKRFLAFHWTFAQNLFRF